MRYGTRAGLGAALACAAALSGCATAPVAFPIQATRYHYDAVATRGTIVVEPMPGGPTAGLEFADYAAAVQAELIRQGYTAPAAAAKPDNVATVAFTRTTRPLPPRRSGLTIGLGAGGYGGGVGGGGGVSFPVGGHGAREGVLTELSVRIRRGPDAIWEGKAQALADLTAPGGADTKATANRLAAAMFTGFPGESGRTIEVK